MKKFRIYSANYCPYCKQAVNLLLYKGAHFEVVDISGNDVARLMLKEATGKTTVPQIYLNGNLIGGYSDLAAHDESGELDILIKGVNDGKNS
jgi:glutaredoxin 3